VTDIYPKVDDDSLEVRDKATDMRERRRRGEDGLIDPITLYEGKILDGRVRYRACLVSGTEPRFEEYEGSDPEGFLVSRNLHRDLSKLQRALIAARTVTAEPGGDHQSAAAKATPQTCGVGPKERTIAEAADKHRISEANVERARTIINNGLPELIDAFLRPTMFWVSWRKAKEVSGASKDDQRQWLHDQRHVINSDRPRPDRPPAPETIPGEKMWRRLTNEQKRRLMERFGLPWSILDWRAQGMTEIALPDAVIRILPRGEAVDRRGRTKPATSGAPPSHEEE
jgi:hypothetical protein